MVVSSHDDSASEEEKISFSPSEDFPSSKKTPAVAKKTAYFH